jgi:hypothetical protein
MVVCTVTPSFLFIQHTLKKNTLTENLTCQKMLTGIVDEAELLQWRRKYRRLQQEYKDKLYV